MDFCVEGVRVVPYRLPELLAANEQGKVIFVVEGEAEADLLHSWGLPATATQRAPVSGNMSTLNS